MPRRKDSAEKPAADEADRPGDRDEGAGQSRPVGWWILPLLLAACIFWAVVGFALLT